MESVKSNILVTGAAGFIGFHLCRQLLSRGFSVIGLDNINSYYSPKLKLDRLKELGIDSVEEGDLVDSSFYEKFQFIKLNLEDKQALIDLCSIKKIKTICNLAAQAGVRYSIENPSVYAESNVVGFLNVLEAARINGIKKVVYASSSSVYGLNEKTPFSTNDRVDHPISLYAATKRSNELMAYTYSHLFGIQTIGLRFFTVYGPWGRPDMAMFLFTDAIYKDEPIKVFNEGKLSRDFTYIDDIISGVTSTLMNNIPDGKLYEVYNIGNGKPVKLMDFINAIEVKTQKQAKKIMMPMQPGDVEKTWADTTALEIDFGYKSNIKIERGISEFVDWFKTYYKL